MIHEDIVTFKQAKFLKELGFDEKTLSVYCKIDEACVIPNPKYWPGKIWHEFSAPTLAQAIKWLRSKNIEVLSYYDYTTKTWIFEVCEIGEPHSCGYHSDDFNLNKPTYEEAISAGIDKALEIYFDKI